MGSIDKSILGTVTLRNDSDNGQHVTVMMYVHTLLGFETDCVVDRLGVYKIIMVRMCFYTDEFANVQVFRTNSRNAVS